MVLVIGISHDGCASETRSSASLDAGREGYKGWSAPMVIFEGN